MLEHAFNLFEKVLDWSFCEVVDIDKRQYGLMPRRGIAFVLSESFKAKNKNLFFVYVDLEKAPV